MCCIVEPPLGGLCTDNCLNGIDTPALPFCLIGTLRSSRDIVCLYLSQFCARSGKDLQCVAEVEVAPGGFLAPACSLLCTGSFLKECHSGIFLSYQPHINFE